MREIYGLYTANALLADLHLHTNRGDGRLTPQGIVDQAVSRHLQAIAITDHDYIGSALEAASYCQDKGLNLEVVIGAEVSTQFRRHVLGLFLNRDIPSGKSLEWTIKAIHDQDGLVVVPHPMYSWTASLTKTQLLEVISSSDDGVYFDGFEIFNAGVGDNIGTKANQNAQKFYRQYEGRLGAAIGGTDAHYYMIGRGLTAFQDNLRESILLRQTSVLAMEEAEVVKWGDILYQQYRGLLVSPLQGIQRMAMRHFAPRDQT